MKRTKRLLTMLLTLVLCVGEISATGLKVFAADEKTITGLGTGAITDPVVLDDIYESWSGSFVYYGKYNGSDPTIYRVLDKDSYEFGVPGEGLFLDCDDTLFQAAHGRLVTEWKNSCIKWLLNGDGFLKKAGNFTAVEEDAIAESTKGSGTGALCGEKIFCLSEKEACSTKYGYLSGIDSSSLSKGGSWWLRDIREWANGGYYGSFINSQGQIMFPTDPGSAMDFEAGVSPAFNISLSSIISSTLVSGESGKT
ncbi:MAG: hypothetical protein J6X66_00115, partial [Lachnospiraceae bacterium]|nr:hypothetical protein [Lachnospiraceae bacterium]